MSTHETAAVYREAFHEGLRDLGYSEGVSVNLIVRYAHGDSKRIPALVDELIAEHVDVMLLIGPAVPIAQKRAPTIPIVSPSLGDPVSRRAGGIVSAPRRESHWTVMGA